MQSPALRTPLKRRMASKINTNDNDLDSLHLIHIARLLPSIWVPPRKTRLQNKGFQDNRNYRPNPEFVNLGIDKLSLRLYTWATFTVNFQLRYEK